MTEQLTVHHIGYMVKDIAKSRTAFERLGFTARTAEIIYDAGRVCYFLFMDNGGSHVELIQPKDETSPVWGLAKKYKNMPYHICFETPDIKATITYLTLSSSGGGHILVQAPAGASAISPTACVAFLMNADIGMIELVQLQ
jgi:methylmalonyl-CoA/ethylmalonyl-CoA epimerase